MDLRYFNIILSKNGYVNNEEMQIGLRYTLLASGIVPMDVHEADLVEAATGKPVGFEVLILNCVESIPGAKELFKKDHNMTEITYEGLPTIM